MSTARLGIDHTGIGITDVEVMSRFYDAVLGALGMVRRMQVGRDGTFVGNDAEIAGIGYGFDFPVFWIDIFHPARTRNHTAFVAASRSEVIAFHEASLAAGGTDNGSPGLRSTSEGHPPGYYAAFVLDPEGNNIEALFRESA